MPLTCKNPSVVVWECRSVIIILFSLSLYSSSRVLLSAWVSSSVHWDSLMFGICIIRIISHHISSCCVGMSYNPMQATTCFYYGTFGRRSDITSFRITLLGDSQCLSFTCRESIFCARFRWTLWVSSRSASFISPEWYLWWHTHTPPQISLAWVKKLDVCNNECHQDFVQDYWGC